MNAMINEQEAQKYFNIWTFSKPVIYWLDRFGSQLHRMRRESL